LAAEDLPTPSMSEAAFTTDPPRPALASDSPIIGGAFPKASSMSEAELPTVRFEDEEDGFAEPPPKAPEPPPRAAEPTRPVAERPVERPAEPARPPTGERVPMAVPASAEEDDIIAVVDEAAWQLELARPARLLQIGWAITGDVVIGNFKDCGVIVPESRSEPHQLFHAAEYFRLKVRGNRGKVELLDPVEARLRVNGEAQNRSLELDGLEMEIIRRDADHDEDFSVVLRLRPEVVLPDPWRPQSMRIVVLPGWRWSEWSTGPMRSTSSLWTMPTSCCAGSSDSRTFAPTAPAETRSRKPSTTS
jgi:hypothetical protein